MLYADNQLAVFPVRFVVQAMAIFKDSLSQWSPHKKGLAEESSKSHSRPHLSSSHPYNQTVLSKEFVEEAVKLLVTRFIPLNPKDLDAWLTDPEEWANVEDNENDHWEYELRVLHLPLHYLHICLISHFISSRVPNVS